MSSTGRGRPLGKRPSDYGEARASNEAKRGCKGATAMVRLKGANAAQRERQIQANQRRILLHAVIRQYDRDRRGRG